MLHIRLILAAVDFSAPSAAALRVAVRAARTFGARLVVIHVTDPLLTTAAGTRGFDLAADSRDELRRFAAASGAADAEQMVVTGVAHTVLCEVASRQQADLLVLAAHGMSGAERLMFGSTTEGVLRRAGLPVLVVPAGWDAPEADAPAGTSRGLEGMGPVVAGVDFDAPSRRAAEVAGSLAGRLGTRAIWTHVVPALPVLERWRAHADDAMAQRVADATAQLTQLAREVSPAAAPEMIVRDGDVAAVLAAVARDAGPRPLLVLGRHRRGEGTPPGAIAYRVLMQARVPVLVVPTASASPAA